MADENATLEEEQNQNQEQEAEVSQFRLGDYIYRYTDSVSLSLLDQKVDKVTGYDLSKNNYSDADKTKLDGIEAGAQVNTPVDSNLSTTSENALQNKIITNKFNEIETSLNNKTQFASGDNPGVVKIGNNLVMEDGVLSGLTPYTLPAATEVILGGVKVGNTLQVNNEGVLNTAPMQIASSETLGGVKIGDGINLDVDGTISVPDQSYTLPPATRETLGGVIVGRNLNIENGVISAPDSGEGDLTAVELTKSAYDNLPIADKLDETKVYFITDTTPSNITLDNLADVTLTAPAPGQILKYDNNNTWVNANEYSYTLPIASSSTLGGVKIDGNGLSIDANGLLSTTGDTTNCMKKGIDYVTAGKLNNSIRGSRATVEGYNTVAYGNNSHTEGYHTTAYGHNSHAEGCSTSAYGIYSHVEGYMTTAYNRCTHAEGYKTCANGDSSHSEGYQTSAEGEYSAHAEGIHTCALKSGSHVEGYYTLANGLYCHAEGRETSAFTQASHAEGTGSIATHASAHAEGTQTCAAGISSHAEGWYSYAIGDCSHSGGWYTTALSHYQTVIGKYNIVDANDEYAFIIGNGSSTTASNAFGVKWNGTVIANGVDILNAIADLQSRVAALENA